MLGHKLNVGEHRLSIDPWRLGSMESFVLNYTSSRGEPAVGTWVRTTLKIIQHLQWLIVTLKRTRAMVVE
jgi:hypothetical protein